jgi:hypothetical protein
MEVSPCGATLRGNRHRVSSASVPVQSGELDLEARLSRQRMLR